MACTLSNSIKKLITDSNALNKQEFIQEISTVENTCSAAMHKYIHNLYANRFEKYEIDDISCRQTRICMMISFDDYNFDKDILLQSQVIGELCRNLHTPVLCVKTYNTTFPDAFVYYTKKHSFDIKVSKLTIQEQIDLIFCMIKVYKTEKNIEYRKAKVNAYLDRLGFVENDKHPLITRIARFYNLLVNEDCSGIEEELASNQNYSLDEIMMFPLVLNREIEIQLGYVTYRYALFEKAKLIFNKYNLHKDEIDCLIALKKNEEACNLIYEQLEKLEKLESFDSKVLCCEYCVKLGWLTGTTKWFDRGHEIYDSFEPLEQKAIYFYKLEKYEESKQTYKDILKIVPNNEKILFAYASVKILLKEYFECIDIFQRLIEMDRNNCEYRRNLALCFYSINDLQNCEKHLKQNSIKDQKSMEMYLKLVIKEGNKKKILWCLSKYDNKKNLNELISYLLDKNILDKADIENKV